MGGPSKAWTKLGERLAYAGFRRVLERRFRLPDGRELPFEVKEEGVVVTVLALTAAREVILVRQFRAGPERVLLELPGGAVDPGEEPQAAARRELLEETGFTGRLTFVGTSLDCAYSTRVRYNFVALDCRRAAEPRGDEAEDVEVELISLSDFRRHLRAGQLTDVETGYLGLDYLGLLAVGSSGERRPASSNAASTSG